MTVCGVLSLRGCFGCYQGVVNVYIGVWVPETGGVGLKFGRA
jgi:hypothetical protein